MTTTTSWDLTSTTMALNSSLTRTVLDGNVMLRGNKLFEDSILNTQHLRFPKFMCMVKNQSMAFLHKFAMEINKLKYSKMIINHKYCVFYISKEFWKKIDKELEINPLESRFLNYKNTKEILVSADVCYKESPIPLQSQQLNEDNKLKQYDMMTDSTSYCWIDLVKKLEKSYDKK